MGQDSLENDIDQEGAWREIAGRLSLIDPLSSEQQTVLKECEIPTRSFSRNEDIFVAGDRQSSLYYCRSGWGARYKVLMDGQRQIIDFVLPGSFFGSHVDDDGQHAVSAKALDNLNLAVINDRAISHIADNNLSILSRIVIALAEEDTRLRERVVSLGRRNAEQRLAHLLLDLDERLAMPNQTPGGEIIHLPIPQQEIADFLGLTSVHVSRTMRAMSNKGLIEYDGNCFAIRRPDELAEIAEFEPVHATPVAIPDLLRRALLMCD